MNRILNLAIGMILSATSCGSDSSPVEGSSPLRTDDSAFCPAPKEIAVHNDSAYPPNHPEIDAVTPDRCYTSLLKLKIAGHAWRPSTRSSHSRSCLPDRSGATTTIYLGGPQSNRESPSAVRHSRRLVGSDLNSPGLNLDI